MFQTYVLPISTQHFPKIPKIILRKPCDEPKHAKTPRERKGFIMLRPGHDNEVSFRQFFSGQTTLTPKINCVFKPPLPEGKHVSCRDIVMTGSCKLEFPQDSKNRA